MIYSAYVSLNIIWSVKKLKLCTHHHRCQRKNNNKMRMYRMYVRRLLVMAQRTYMYRAVRRPWQALACSELFFRRERGSGDEAMQCYAMLCDAAYCVRSTR